ncbi:hypothetical protein T06_14928 [Trichinella sp. T6]|nr:hypothetical protein T06_14928 [Trichinella sp. T6]
MSTTITSITVNLKKNLSNQKLSSSIFSLKSLASYALHFQSKAGKNFVPIFTHADSTSVELSVRHVSEAPLLTTIFFIPNNIFIQRIMEQINLQKK